MAHQGPPPGYPSYYPQPQQQQQPQPGFYPQPPMPPGPAGYPAAPGQQQPGVVMGYPMGPGGGGPWAQQYPDPGGFSKDRAQTARTRENYMRTWQADLMASCCTNPGACLCAVLCPPCMSYHLRRRALYNDMSRYQCCGGYLPCSGQCGETACPELCLACEVLCCFPNSVAVTRFLIQDEMQIGNTQCDNCLIFSMFCEQSARCTARADASRPHCTGARRLPTDGMHAEPGGLPHRQ